MVFYFCFVASFRVRRESRGGTVRSEATVLIQKNPKKQYLASGPVIAYLPLTSLCRQTAQLGQWRNLGDPNRQLLTPEHANEPGGSTLVRV